MLMSLSSHSLSYVWRKHMLMALTLLLVGGCIYMPQASFAEADAQTSKSATSVLKLDQDNHNSDALKIAKSLKPSFFDVRGMNVDFLARYIELDPENPERFLMFTSSDVGFYCTSHGCPFYIYENKNGEWHFAFSIQTIDMMHDVSDGGNIPHDLIVHTFSGKTKRFHWTDQGFIKTEAKTE